MEPNATTTTTTADLDEASRIISTYVREHPHSSNTQLFSFLALLKAYVPDSSLRMSECQQILRLPDLIDEPCMFTERMEPFTAFIDSSNPDCVHVSDPNLAKEAVEMLHGLRLTRSKIVQNFMRTFLVCNSASQEYITPFINHLLRKRETTNKRKEKFSRLIEDVMEKERFIYAVAVLRTASNIFRHNAFFPQTIARSYYITRGINKYSEAEKWAKEAIARHPKNSHVADTLGQIYKHHLMRGTLNPKDTADVLRKAIAAFDSEVEKAEEEVSSEEMDGEGTVSSSCSFNNRGYFGFMQVAKITFQKVQLSYVNYFSAMKVESNFDFFERYLTYSSPDMTTLEPFYFWRDVVHCYELITDQAAAESTSFPGLLNFLSHGLFMSKGRRAGFEETEKTVVDLEVTRDTLKDFYEANTDNCDAVERYILSNILLSNKMHDSPHLTPLGDLRMLLHTFMMEEVSRRSPEFYLLVLLLFWPEGHHQLGQINEGGAEQATIDGPDDSDDNQEAAVPTELLRHLQEYVELMEEAFERVKYAKYYQGRYLCPLFFLGKGSGLCKWVHKSKLDAIVERQLDAALADESKTRHKKEEMITGMWSKGEVWKLPEIQDIVLPVKVEPCQSPLMPVQNDQQQVFVTVGREKIKARVVAASAPSPKLYLGYTIRGPVVFSG